MREKGFKDLIWLAIIFTPLVILSIGDACRDDPVIIEKCTQTIEVCLDELKKANGQAERCAGILDEDTKIFGCVKEHAPDVLQGCTKEIEELLK